MNFLEVVLAKWLVAIAALSGSTVAAPVGNLPAEEARTAAVHRQRHVIFNNDGVDASYYADFVEGPPTKEGLLSIRMDHIGDCGVDCVFYCTTHGFNYFTHDSKVTEVFTTTEGAFKSNRTTELIKVGADPLKVAIEACRRRNIEIFYTLRLNDIHDNFWPEMISQWKKNHPQFLLGTPADKEKYPFSDPRHVWTYADFAHQEVRDLIVLNIQDVLNRYDVDGVDLDFLRHPAFFKETLLAQPVTQEHLSMLTEMVGKVRKQVLTASERRGKPILLSVRVLPTLALNRHFGFDVERWGKEGLVDIVCVGGGYDPFTMPLKDMVDRGHAWGLPVYACLSGSGFGEDTIAGVKNAQAGDIVECWRAAAANTWLAGADGIMTFNLFPCKPGTPATKHAREVWKDIGDPRALAMKDKLYCIEKVDGLWNTPYMVRTVPIDGRLPVGVKKGSTVECVLPVADDISGLKDGIETLRLRIGLAGLQAGDKLDVKMNGAPLDLAAEKPEWLGGDVPPSIMKKGENVLKITFAGGAADSLTINAVELAVKYKRKR